MLKLKLKRIALGIKQKDLAESVGITPQYLMLIEQGKASNPSLDIMRALADELDGTIDELFDKVKK